MLHSNLAVLKDEAAQLLTDSWFESGQTSREADEKAMEAVPFLCALELMDRIRDDDKLLFRVTPLIEESV